MREAKVRHVKLDGCDGLLGAGHLQGSKRLAPSGQFQGQEAIEKRPALSPTAATLPSRRFQKRTVKHGAHLDKQEKGNQRKFTSADRSSLPHGNNLQGNGRVFVFPFSCFHIILMML